MQKFKENYSKYLTSLNSVYFKVHPQNHSLSLPMTLQVLTAKGDPLVISPTCPPPGRFLLTKHYLNISFQGGTRGWKMYPALFEILPSYILATQSLV